MVNALAADLRIGRVPDGLLNLAFAAEDGGVEVEHDAPTPTSQPHDVGVSNPPCFLRT